MPNKLYAARDFNDAGTGKSFKRGAEIVASPGELANYEAGGLTTETAPEQEASAPATNVTPPSPLAPAVTGKPGSLTA